MAQSDKEAKQKRGLSGGGARQKFKKGGLPIYKGLHKIEVLGTLYQLCLRAFFFLF